MPSGSISGDVIPKNMVADIEVDMVADMEVDMVADIDIDININMEIQSWSRGFINWAQTFLKNKEK